jgi:hypothetical protein
MCTLSILKYFFINLNDYRVHSMCVARLMIQIQIQTGRRKKVNFLNHTDLDEISGIYIVCCATWCNDRSIQIEVRTLSILKYFL